MKSLSKEMTQRLYDKINVAQSDSSFSRDQIIDCLKSQNDEIFVKFAFSLNKFKMNVHGFLESQEESDYFINTLDDFYNRSSFFTSTGLNIPLDTTRAFSLIDVYIHPTSISGSCPLSFVPYLFSDLVSIWGAECVTDVFLRELYLTCKFDELEDFYPLYSKPIRESFFKTLKNSVRKRNIYLEKDVLRLPSAYLTSSEGLFAPNTFKEANNIIRNMFIKELDELKKYPFVKFTTSENHSGCSKDYLRLITKTEFKRIPKTVREEILATYPMLASYYS